MWIAGVIISEFVQLLVDRDNAPSSFFGHSQCDHCKKQVPWYGLLPVIGYFLVRGECIHCHKKINPKYPLFELSFGIFWAVTIFFFGTNLLLLAVSFFLLCIVFYLAYYDYSYHEVPVAALGLLPVAYGILYFMEHVELNLYGIAIMFIIVLLSVLAVRFTKKDVALEDIFGPADWFVLLLAGLFIGAEPAVILVITSVVLLGIFYGVQFLLAKKTIKGVPFLFWYLPILYIYTIYILR